MSSLTERLVAVHEALDAAALAHAFGGAIALAFCTEEPRGTRDLDLNVFSPPEEARAVFDALPDGIGVTDVDVAAAQHDGQVRLWWEETPIDVFFDVHAFYRYVSGRVRSVPFAGTRIPVLDCVSLAVFKGLYNRTRDWADIEAMLEAGAIDGAETLVWLCQLLGDEAQPVQRLTALIQRAGG